MRPRKKARRALPVLEATETVRCERLRASLALGSCVARWRLAQDQTVIRLAWSGGRVARGEQYASCRDCEVGKGRAGGGR